LADYGFSRWNPKDAGANQTLEEAAGASKKTDKITEPWNNDPNGLESDYHNDARFMYDDEGEEKEGVLAYLDYVNANKDNPDSKPFCLIISLVNPHDVLFLGNDTFDQAGYGDSDKWVSGDIHTPASMVTDDLSTKPEVQKRFLNLSVGLGNLNSEDLKTQYVNFYGNLIKSSDAYLDEVLRKLEALDLIDDTLVIKTSDHGEMGLAHGGMRQKNFNFYEESIRVPLVYSNKKLFGNAETSDELVSHVDFLPTLASLVGAPAEARNEKWQGIDYSSLITRRPGDNENFEGQEYIVFTYDDWQAGQAQPPYAGQSTRVNPTVAPNHIVGIREKRYKFAEYYDAGNFSDSLVDSEYEMYDLEDNTNDPEVNNLANDVGALSAPQKVAYKRLMNTLDTVKANLGIVTKGDS
jgi:arylsulfatase A-like enzyme